MPDPAEPGEPPADRHRLPAAPSPSEASAAGLLAGSQNGAGVGVALAVARFNWEVTSRLLEGAREALDRLGASAPAGTPCLVPGAFELPLAARALASRPEVDAVACLGCVIRGETSHYDFVAGECAAGLQRVQLDTGVPVVFGVLTTENLSQALERSGGAYGNKGAEAVETAVEMVRLLAALESPLPPGLVPPGRPGTA